MTSDIGWADKARDDPKVIKLHNHLEANNGIKGLEILDSGYTNSRGWKGDAAPSSGPLAETPSIGPGEETPPIGSARGFPARAFWSNHSSPGGTGSRK